jgi:MFS family permease
VTGSDAVVPGAARSAAGRTAAKGGAPGPGRTGWALTLVSAAQFVLQLDFSIVNVALPTIQRELGFSPADLQWIVTGYALTFGSLLLLGGRLGDVVGRRRLLMTGLILFGVTSLSAGLAQTSLALVISRFAQGASAAVVAPTALASVTDLYAEGPGRARALGIFQGATAAGASAGIVFGGILTQYVGWRSVFLVNPPIIAVLVVAIARVLPRQGNTARVARLDVGGAVLATAAAACAIYGLSQGQQQGFTAPLTLSALGAAVVLATVFVVTEQRVAAPMVPLGVLGDPLRRTALIVMALMGAVVAGYVYFISLYMQRVLLFSPLLTGIALIPATGTVMVTSMLLTRRLLARFGVRTLLAAGLVLAGLGQVWLSQIGAHGNYPVNVLGGLLLTSLGMGIAFPSASVAVTAGMTPSERGLAGGLFVTAQQLGQAIGLAALATIAADRTLAAHGSLVSGYRLSYAVSAGIVLATIAAMALPGLRPRENASGRLDRRRPRSAEVSASPRCHQ